MQILISVSIFFAVFGALIFTRQRPVVIFSMAILVSLLVGGISVEQILHIAVNPGVMTLLLLLLCTSVLEKSILLPSFKRKILSKSYAHTYWRLVSLTALLSAFLNNTAVVAALMGMIKNNGRFLSSKLLIPLSYAAILGGTITLIGTSTNLIVNSFLLEQTDMGLAFLDFAPIGLAVTIVCLIVLYFLLPWLPELKEPETISKEYFIETKVQEDSSLIGNTVVDNGLRQLDSIFLVELSRKGKLITPVSPGEIIEAGDRLIFSGDISRLPQIEQIKGLALFASNDGLLTSNLIEVVVSSRASIIGKTIKNSSFRSLFDAAVVAIRRGEERLSGKLGEIQIREGDSLILAIGPDFLSRRNIDKNFHIVSDVKLDNVLSKSQSYAAIAGFMAVILLAATSILPLLEGGLYLLGFFFISKMTSSSELTQRIPYSLWIIISSALALATMLQQSGAIHYLTELLQSSLILLGPYQALIVLYLFTMILTELITNNAAAALAFPLAMAFSESLNVDLKPFVMAVALGASASFMIPYGYQTNLMVFNLGKYRKKDFLKVGVVISFFYGVTVLILIPRVFPF